MISRLMAVTSHMFRTPGDDHSPDLDDIDGDVIDPDHGHVGIVTTTFVFYPDEPDTVTLVSERRNAPDRFVPYSFELQQLVELVEFGESSSYDGTFAMGRDDAAPEWVFVNCADHPLVLVRLQDIKDFLSAACSTRATCEDAISDRDLAVLLKGAR